MSTRRRANASNFRANGMDPQRGEAKGTRPTAAPASIQDVLFETLLHICKKIVFFNTNLKAILYLGILFLVSSMADISPFPKTYFARSDNALNVIFVKMGWAWTLAPTIPYLLLTTRVLCCRNTERMLKHHFLRLIIATAFWFVWTKSFNLIESAYGRCNVRSFDTKSSCLKGGHFWNGFDISGHAFILIYSSLVLIEEARSINYWESISVHLRNEEHDRATGESSSTNPLRNLSETELQQVKSDYTKYTPIINLLFLAMTALVLLWDLMLFSTIMYYHKMIEKIISAMVAVVTWFFTYRIWYAAPVVLPNVVGSGQFQYQKPKNTPAVPLRKHSMNATAGQRSNATGTNRSDKVPTFMGMPLYTQQQLTSQQQQQQQ